MMDIGTYEFGEIEVDGNRYAEDIKIVNGSIILNWWRLVGHELSSEDIEEILSARPEVLVVGQGQPGNMKVLDELREKLEASGIALIEEPTAKAVHTFNKLKRSGKKVAGAFHLTC